MAQINFNEQELHTMCNSVHISIKIVDIKYRESYDMVGSCLLIAFIAAAMTCSNTFTFVGDRGGTLHMLKCEHKPGVHMAFSPCYHASHPHGKKCAVSGIQHLGYSVITKGPALLVTYTDSTVGIYKVHDTVS